MSKKKSSKKNGGNEGVIILIIGMIGIVILLGFSLAPSIKSLVSSTKKSSSKDNTSVATQEMIDSLDASNKQTEPSPEDKEFIKTLETNVIPGNVDTLVSANAHYHDKDLYTSIVLGEDINKSTAFESIKKITGEILKNEDYDTSYNLLYFEFGIESAIKYSCTLTKDMIKTSESGERYYEIAESIIIDL